MVRVPIATTVLALSLLHRPDSDARAQQPDPQLSSVDSIATRALTQYAVPGLSVAVIRRGELVFAKGYGKIDRESGAPATPESIFLMASISKPFTAAAILRLAERGLVELRAPVSRYLPEFTPRGDSITVENLLHQTSGLHEFWAMAGIDSLVRQLDGPLANVVSLIERHPLSFSPGSRWVYNNANYSLLAAIIERVVHRPYDDVLTAEFLRPLGLRSIHHCESRPTGAEYARGTTLGRNGLRATPFENGRWASGASGLCGNVIDVARWMSALAKGRAISPSSYRMMTTGFSLPDGTTPAYGFGLSLVPLDGHIPRVNHGGVSLGFSGKLAYYPQADLTIAILTNRRGLWVESIENAMARALLAVAVPRSREVAQTSVDRSRVVGSFDLGIEVARIIEHDGRLRMEMPEPGVTTDLVYEGDGVYAGVTDPGMLKLRFSPVGGRATKLVLVMAGLEWYGVRKN